MNTDFEAGERILVNVGSTITCPSCKHEFRLDMGFASQALAAVVQASRVSLEDIERNARAAEEARADLRVSETERSLREQLQSLRDTIALRDRNHEAALLEVREVERRGALAQLAAMKESLAARDAQYSAMAEKVNAAELLSINLAEKEQKFEERVALAAESRARVLAEQQYDQRLQGLASELALATERLQSADEEMASLRQNELELRRARQALEDEKRRLELDVQRRVDEQCHTREQRVRDEVLAMAKIRETDFQQKIDDLNATIDLLRRKAEQGSQERQGEVFEALVERGLQGACPLDEFDPVKKGQRGADVLHRVMTRTGQRAATILWEFKRAANWSQDWVRKLKADQNEAGADLAVIVVPTIPRDIIGGSVFGLFEDVWVTSYSAAASLAEALRYGALEAYKQRQIAAGRDEKAEAAYDYLTSPQFAQKVRAVYESFRAMRDDLASEKSSTQQRWNRRERQLERAMSATLAMAGDIQAISEVPMPQLELEQPATQVSQPRYDA